MGINLNQVTGALIILVMVAAVIGISLVIVAKIGDEARYNVAANESVTFTAVEGNGQGVLTNYPVYSISQILNSSTVYVDGNFTNSEATLDKVTGEVYLNNMSLLMNGDLNISYTYEAATTATTAMTDSVTNLDDFITWIAIIILALAGGIVFTLVMRAFKGK